jgi:hypothetical protein
MLDESPGIRYQGFVPVNLDHPGSDSAPYAAAGAAGQRMPCSGYGRLSMTRW